MINAFGQAIDVPKDYPSNWIFEVGTDTRAWGSRTSPIIICVFWGIEEHHG